MNTKDKWVLPSLNKARARHRDKVNIIRDVNLSESQQLLGSYKKYYIRTYGCQANERDSETLAGLLESMNYVATSDEKEADVILLNTCSIRENANNKVFGEIGQLKHLKVQNPDLIIGVCGCMVQEEVIVQKILKTYPQVDLIFGTHNIHRLPTLLEHAYLSKEKTVEVYSQEGDIVENLPVSRFGKHKAWVNIMYGCDKFCTYCIVPFTRGKERSRLVDDILTEVLDLKDKGFKEVTLLGQNVNAYGKDLNMEDGFAYLLEQVALTGINRIRFTTSHPWNFSDKMIEVIAKYDNIMPYIHLPLQSGSDSILSKMARRYTVKEYIELYDKIKKLIPDCAVSTDIIVGFPNESDKDFEKTLEVFDYCQYDNAYTFIFSPRSGTPAALMPDDIDSETKKDRLYNLNNLVKKYALMNNQKYLNQIVEVLVDGPSKKDENVWSGYSRHQKLVNFVGDDCAVGDIVKVKITNVKTWFLSGELVKE